MSEKLSGWKKNFDPKKILCPKIFLGLKKIFGPKELLVKKKVWVKKKFLGKKKYWIKKICGLKIFGSNNHFGSDMVWVQENFGSPYN